MAAARRSRSQQRRSRWTGFLNDVQNESVTFKEVLLQSAVRKEQSNRDCQTFAQLSFNAIPNVVRKQPDPARMTPDDYSRLRGFPPRAAKPSNPPNSLSEYETHIRSRARRPGRSATRNSLI
jgi:hypothetical protein